jgi:hypothetical protein
MQDWPAVAYHLPQSNNLTATPNIRMKSSSHTPKNPYIPTIRCFFCQENHHIQDCPRKLNNLSSKKPLGGEAWKYVEPKDLSSSIIDNKGRT